MFFFQAEDGIRDLVRSRGLGDVYKRQDLQYLVAVADHRHFGRAATACAVSQPTLSTQLKTVSYTHLTLPTSDLV